MSSPNSAVRAAAGAAAATSDVGAIGATTAMRVAAELRRRILVGELAPGTHLKLDEIATQCAVSHMPVREALHELEGEGVVDVYPHRGTVVRRVDAQFVRNLYDVRGAIEGMLTERCAGRIDAAGSARLEAAMHLHVAAAKKRKPAAIVDANRALHDAINDVAANPQAVRVLAQGRLLIEALRVRFGYGAGRVDDVIDEHRALVRAIAKHDVAKAGALARRHCIAARDDLLAMLGQGRHAD